MTSKPRTNAFGEWIGQAVSGLMAPEVRADRCVHALIETARCQRCVKVCPTEAWVIDDSQLGIDVSRCDACGLCVASCPESALAVPVPVALRRWEDDLIGLAACEKADVGPRDGRLACLHAIGLNQLVDWYRRGVRRLLVSHGDCAQCVRANAPRLQAVLTAFNELLSERGLPQVFLVDLSIAEWRGVEATTRAGVAVSRRAAIRRVGAGTVGVALQGGKGGSAADEQSAVAPGSLLPRSGAAQRLFYAPSIDPQRCNGCDACIKVCPHGALAYVDDPPAYRIAADDCTGCLVCCDVCDREAVEVTPWGHQVAATVPLVRARCCKCGVRFHFPEGVTAADDLCRICAENASKNNLYQVLD